jgi:hypothetical protein
MNKGEILAGAAFLVLGLAGTALAQDHGAAASREQQGASGRFDSPGDNPNSSYSSGNPSPNNKIGDHQALATISAATAATTLIEYGHSTIPLKLGLRSSPDDVMPR